MTPHPIDRSRAREVLIRDRRREASPKALRPVTPAAQLPQSIKFVGSASAFSPLNKVGLALRSLPPWKLTRKNHGLISPCQFPLNGSSIRLLCRSVLAAL